MSTGIVNWKTAGLGNHGLVCIEWREMCCLKKVMCQVAMLRNAKVFREKVLTCTLISRVPKKGILVILTVSDEMAFPKNAKWCRLP